MSEDNIKEIRAIREEMNVSLYEAKRIYQMRKLTYAIGVLSEGSEDQRQVKDILTQILEILKG